jgi:hypothetical protein
MWKTSINHYTVYSYDFYNMGKKQTFFPHINSYCNYTLLFPII